MRLLFLLLLFVLAVGGAHAQQERLALVIGNAEFERSKDLPQTAEDARAMAAKLQSLDFRLIGGQPHINLSRADILRQIRALGREAEAGDEIVFYFSGHGIGGTQTNYLLPVNDGDIETREDVPDLAIDVASILDRLPEGDTGANIFILDACRDNPLPSRAKSSFAQKGLTRVSNGSSNTVFLYAAEPGERAYVSNSGRSFFTDALLSELDVPGKNLTDLMRRVRLRVSADTRAEAIPQIPWIEGLTSEPFYFRRAVVEAVEVDAWQSARDEGTIPALLDFLTRFPDGQYSDQAQSLITMRSGFVTRTAANRVGTADAPTEASKEEKRRPGDSFKDCEECPEMVVIPSGEFTMGSPPGETLRNSDEGPQRLVQIDYEFAVGKYELTIAQYRAFVRATNHSTGVGCWADLSGNGTRVYTAEASWTNIGRPQSDTQPVACISWETAQSYVEWLSRKTGESYRLLSESEFEYANRAGITSLYAWGSDHFDGCRWANGADASGKARYSDWSASPCDDGHVHAAPVGSYQSNAFGLYDMTGNVFEWTEDCFRDNYYGAPTDGSARMVGNCAQRVLRGGAFSSEPTGLRSALRIAVDPSFRSSGVGFRVARDISP